MNMFSGHDADLHVITLEINFLIITVMKRYLEAMAEINCSENICAWK